MWGEAAAGSPANATLPLQQSQLQLVTRKAEQLILLGLIFFGEADLEVATDQLSRCSDRDKLGLLHLRAGACPVLRKAPR